MTTMQARDPREVPAYPLNEASRYAKVAPATLRSWVVGRPYPIDGGTRQFQPLIHPASKAPLLLSFWNLVEAHVLSSLRLDHRVGLKAVRTAVSYAERELKVKRLLLSKELQTAGGQLFLLEYGRLINLSASGQIALKKVFEEHLKRVDWDAQRFPIRLYPFVAAEKFTGGRPIAIDPLISFGRPVVLRAGVSTRAIAERLDAGESKDDLVSDYGLTPEEVEQAALYEHAA